VLQQSLDYRLISQAAAAAFAAARLLHFRLRTRFPFLFSYLVIQAIASAFFSATATNTRLYFWGYIALESIVWFVAAFAVREMFTLIFKDYPGLRTAGRWALYGALVLSIIGSLIIGAVFAPGRSHAASRLFYQMVLDRSINLSLTAIILILMLFLSRYPLNLDRNTYVASGFFSAMFLVEATIKLADSLSPHLNLAYLDYAGVGFTALCLMGWGIMLQAPNNEPAPVRPQANKQRETELLQQLETMNRILSRSVGQ
jgi:hypothetical protein